MIETMGTHYPISLLAMCRSPLEFGYPCWGDRSNPGDFNPTRWLRQWGPIIPYLFLLCAKALSSLITHAEETGAIQGFEVCMDAPSVSHLFADDSLILMRANDSNAKVLRDLFGFVLCELGAADQQGEVKCLFQLEYISRGEGGMHPIEYYDWIVDRLEQKEVTVFSTYSTECAWE